MSSALEARPRLRDDLKIVRRESHGQIQYIVKQPEEDKYYRFGPAEVCLMRGMNGERSPAEVAEAASHELGVLPPAEQVADFAHKLKRLGLVERTPAERHLMLMERLRRQRKVRAGGRTKGSILRMRYSFGDPDRLFTRMVGRLRWFWTPGFVVGSSVLFVVYALILISGWDRFWSAVVDLYQLRGFTLGDWIVMYGLGLIVTVVHEFGHGLTTKYFGGEVHEMGGMLLYFSPAMYCNTNDAWTFEKRSHRLWVTFAGPWIEMVIAALAAVVYVLTEPGSPVHHIAFLTVLVGGISAVFANANPLIPLDGYYALSDWLEIPNLRKRSFEYWGWLLRRYALGVDAAAPPATPRERRTFLIYGGLAFVYSVLIAVVSLVWLISVLGGWLGPWIWLLLGILALRLLGRAAGRSRALATAAATTWRAGFLHGRRAGLLLVAVTAFIALPFLLPWTFRARGEFQVEPARRAWVRAEVPGIVDRLEVGAGDTVRTGERLAVLWNPEVESAFLEAHARVRLLRAEAAAAESNGDLAATAAANAELAEAENELAIVSARRDGLEIRAPAHGIVLGYRLQERTGEALAAGDLLFEIGSPTGRIARIRLPLREGGEVAAGQPVSLKIPTRPGSKFRARVGSVAPAAEDGWLEAEVPLPDGGWRPAPGSQGVAKIATRRSNVAGAVVRAARRTFRLDLWL